MFKKKETPNCKLCVWRISLLDPNPKIKSVRPGCEAQGSIDCAKVYNTITCRKLYAKEQPDTTNNEKSKR